MNDKKKKRMTDLSEKFARSFGNNASKLGGLRKKRPVVPTGSLALDYELGTGGWPLGKLCGVFGARDIGKSSMVGLNGVRNAQQLGFTCAWIAYEPFDEEWAEANGVIVEELFVLYPTHAEEAWAMLHQVIECGEIDFVVFDSVGALRGKSEIGDDAKARVGGVALINTWGVSVAGPLADRHDVGVILLNQQRVKMNVQTGRGVLYGQPGGEALEHMEQIIVQLKRGPNKYTIKQNNTDVLIGSEIKAVIHRNKCSQGSGKVATFDYFYSEADGHKLGVDLVSDVVNTGVRTGAIKKSGSWYTLPNGERFQGVKPIGPYLEENPEALEQIREGVLEAMDRRNAEAGAQLEEVEAVEEELAEVS